MTDRTQTEKRRPPAALLPAEIAALGPDELLVNELYTSIQGESTRAGRPCFFIRLTGCPLRCTYCDTEHAFFEGERRTVAECVARARRSGCRLVEVTGGEPLVQRAAPALLAALCNAGLEVLLETSGALPLDGIDPRVRKIVDIKCPSSGMESRNLPGLAAQLGERDEVKLVIGDRRDFEWTCGWLSGEGRSLPPGIPIHLSPVHGKLAPAELAAWLLEARGGGDDDAVDPAIDPAIEVRLQIQLHRVIWPERDRGV